MVFLLILIFISQIYADSQLFYVDKSVTGKNSGSCWADAFKDLQEALRKAGNGDTVCIAEGIYYPAPERGSRNSTFYIRPGLSVFGGYKSGGTERNCKVYKTVLSGDLGRNDIVENDSILNMEDNVFHVITSEGIENLVLDGITITGGNCGGYDQKGKRINGTGGGLFIHIWNGMNTSGLVLRNCVIKNNRAHTMGGGLFFQGSVCEIKNCRFENNRSGYSQNTKKLYGGGAYIESYVCRIDSAEWKKNRSVEGGAIAYKGNNVIMHTLNLKANSALRGGGALWFCGENMIAEDLLCEENYSQGGRGGILLFRGRNLTVKKMQADGNSASGTGGAIDFRGDVAIIDSCEFKKNTSGKSGGFISFFGKEMFLKNSVIKGNTAQHFTGGGFYFEGDLCKIEKCVFRENTALENGGAGTFRGKIFKCIKSEYTNNKSVKRDGGAVDFMGDSCIVEKSLFVENFAIDGKGGALNLNGKIIKIHENVFKKNQSFCGGAVDFMGDSCIIEKSRFAGNCAKEGNGGALNLTGKIMNLYKNVFKNNLSNNGGAAFVDQDFEWAQEFCEENIGFVINRSQFTKNKASLGGGALAWRGKGTVENSDFTGNVAANGGAVKGLTYKLGQKILYGKDSVMVNKSRLEKEIKALKQSVIRKTVFKDNEADEGSVSSEWTGVFECCSFDNDKNSKCFKKKKNDSLIYGPVFIDRENEMVNRDSRLVAKEKNNLSRSLKGE